MLQEGRKLNLLTDLFLVYRIVPGIQETFVSERMSLTNKESFIKNPQICIFSYSACINL